MLKVISRLFWFCITTLCDWLTKLAPFSQPMGIQIAIVSLADPNQNQSCFGRTHFPALGASYMYLLRILVVLFASVAIGQSNYLVLRHSIGNCSTTTDWTFDMTKDERWSRQFRPFQCFQVNRGKCKAIATLVN